jgi:hypothetical protein
MLAACCGRLRAVAMLLERGADARVRDAWGRTAWEVSGVHPRVRWLLGWWSGGGALNTAGGALTMAGGVGVEL